MSYLRDELFLWGVIAMIILLAISLLEGIFWFFCGVSSCIFDYVRARSAHDVEGMKRYRNELKNEVFGMWSLPLICVLVCVFMAPGTILSAILETKELIWQKLKSKMHVE